MCHNYTGGCSNPLHGVHGEYGCLTSDTCTTTTVEQRSSDNNSNGSSDNKNNTSTNTIEGNWARNLSKTPLTEAQEFLVAHGPNFVIVPKEPPTCEYIAATQKACQHLMQGKVGRTKGRDKVTSEEETKH